MTCIVSAPLVGLKLGLKLGRVGELQVHDGCSMGWATGLPLPLPLSSQRACHRLLPPAMLVRRHVPLLESTLRARPLRLLAASQCSRLRYSSTSAAHPERIAVLGGGIAGLASAFFASREFPNTKITVYEGSAETGGWIKSKRVQVPGGEVNFETGPRTLRNSTVTAHLVQELGLVDDLVFTKRSEPGANNRFIYYPDRLNRLPSKVPTLGELFTLARSGILRGALGVIKEPLQPKRPAALSDETVGSFLARRMDKRFADNLVSAVFHGIYAGNIWQLSARTLLSMAWQLEDKYGSALGGLLRMQHETDNGNMQIMAHPYDLDAARAMQSEIDLDLDLAENLKDASVFSFQGGMQTLARGLQDAMEKTGNIEIRAGSPVASFSMADGADKQVEVIAGVRTPPTFSPTSPC
jgi:oxygen-dependent protoporphyrinogen oxidase